MSEISIKRKDLDNQEFLKLRQATERISNILTKRLKTHLDILKPLFLPRKLLGTYIKSAFRDEVAGSDKSFATLQERYAAICEKPFKLPKKLKAPLAPIANQLEVTPYTYPLHVESSDTKAIQITSPTKWILSYRSDCPIPRLKAMLAGSEPPQPDDMIRSLIDHLVLVIFLEKFPALKQILEDLRYDIELEELEELGGLQVVVAKAPVETFLPPDEFILQITQLSGVPAFQEIVDLEALQEMADPLKESLISAVA
ncbi:MAG TPA: hypothetical protein ENG51_21005 [Deltaproteobacteria bacterium]|nr:MAG: hypothetical protein DRG83_17675 [Deltaproteobacteria bacterium]RLB09783.1 MAG: hypothetical protein DRG59_01320 [Deltaproteobacteria bacterium]HDM78913.1 hypothetical protein [Deltaproteobacteria bacterium]